MMDHIMQTLLLLPGLILGFSMHEFAHAWMSHMLGDPTPRAQGRLTLNPAAHIDPLGLLLLVICHFGWGKPVQIDPRYYKHRRSGQLLVSLAGVTMNLILAVISMGLARIVCMIPMSQALGTIILQVLTGMAQINLVLMIFNLIPLPPLDGWGVVTQIFDLERKPWYWNFYRLGPMFLMILIITRATSFIISPLVSGIYSILWLVFFGLLV